MDPTDADIVWQWARAVDDGRGALQLEFEDPADCRRCREGRGCGAGQFARLFRRGGPLSLPAPDGLSAGPGARVRVGVTGRWLLVAAASLYLAPIVAFIAGVVLVVGSGGSEPLALAGGLLLGFGCWVVLPRLLRRGLRPGLRLGEVLESGADGNHVDAGGGVSVCPASFRENARK